MMTKTCPGCGFASGAEARYCRMCGTALQRAGGLASGGGGDDLVSPLANTVPLGGERRPTEDISPHDTASPVSSATARVSREELEEFRRRAEESHARRAEAAADQTPAGARDYFARHAAEEDDEVTIHVRPIGGRSRAAGDTALTARDAPGQNKSDAAAVPVTGELQEGRDAGRGRAVGNATENRALRLWAGLAVFGVVIVLAAAAAVVVGWFALRSMRGETAATAPAGGTVTVAPAEDAKRRAGDKLAEAEQLLAAGRADEAVARLRESAALDPSNAEPHRRLARLLIEGGARRTGIEELRAVLAAEPADAWAWRELAAAQAAEGLHGDAAASYRRLFDVSEDARRDDRLRLSYADALLRSGRESEARAAYERLASSRVAGVARESRDRLARLEREDEGEDDDEERGRESATASPAQTPAASARAPEAGEGTAERVRAETAVRGPAEAAPASEAGRAQAAQLSPRERYERGARLWPSNRTAALADFTAAAQAGNAEAPYYLGLNLVEGRDPRALRRGELVAALGFFQRARRGRHAGAARVHEEQLVREYDRRRAAGAR